MREHGAPDSGEACATRAMSVSGVKQEEAVSDKERYQQELQAQLDAWKKEVGKLKAISSKASADAQLAMKEHVEALEAKIDEGNAKLSELSNASEEAWESMKESVESAWASLKSAFKDIASKFKV